MSNVNIHVTYNGQTTYLRTIAEATLVNFSRVVRDALADQEGNPKRLNLAGAARGPLEKVIDLAIRFGDKTRVNVTDKPFPNVFRLHQAINALGFEPAQPQVEGRLSYLLANETFEPSTMIEIHQAFGHLGSASKPWRVMIDQIAWDVLNHENHNERQVAALREEALKWPDLFAAVKAKVKDLQQKRREREAAKQQQKEERDRQRAQGRAGKGRRGKKLEEKKSGEGPEE